MTESNYWLMTLKTTHPVSIQYKNQKQSSIIFVKKKGCFSQRAYKVIVIDPGHGGKDPGAIGVNRAKEKDITLAVAKRIQQHFANETGFKVFLTRKDDRYLGLRERISVAQKYSPDLFISIHADSARNKKAQGLSVYALSVGGATSEQAKWLAQDHNLDENKLTDPVNGILFQLTQTASIISSLELGSKILSNARPVKVHSQHVEQAGFVVLKGFDVPSVLIELGFLSSSDEAQQLIKASHQERLAHVIESGIFSFFNVKKVQLEKYTIKVGDTLHDIAKQKHISLTKLLNLRSKNVGLPGNPIVRARVRVFSVE